MRFLMLVAGVVVGVVLYNRYLEQQQTANEGPTFTPAPAQHKHNVNADGDREAVASLLDEVVHEPDAPETPIKQAFQQAVER